MKAGDINLIVQVTSQDIQQAILGDAFNTSLGIAIKRQVSDIQNTAAISLGNYNMNVGGFLYNLDAASIAFCNVEVAGLQVTLPYTAYLTLATII